MGKQMKSIRIILLITFFISFNSANLFAQWEKKSKGIPEYRWDRYRCAIDAIDSVNAVAFLSPENFPNIVTESFIYLTNNNGRSWDNIPLPDSLDEYFLEDISMTKPREFYFTLKDEERRYIFKYSDSTLIKQYENNQSPYLPYIKMFNADSGICVGESFGDYPAPVLKTTNGGEDWMNRNSEYLHWVYTSDDWRGIEFVNMETGYFLQKWSYLYKTTTGGMDWDTVDSYTDVGNIGSPSNVKFYDLNYGLVAGEDEIAYTTDAGASWKERDVSYNGYVGDVEFIPNNPHKMWISVFSSHAYAGKLFLSSDSGKTFNEHVFEDSLHFIDICFVNENVGWMVTSEGVYYTNNGGKLPTVMKERQQTQLKNFKLSQNYPNPFNPETKIKYKIPRSTNYQFVRVKLIVYDILGRKVKTLVNKDQKPGAYEITFNAGGIPSGVYFYRLRVENKYKSSRKMIIMK
jgi:photosystem II stability/assembly factor-like uncharacterized protein